MQLSVKLVTFAKGPNIVFTKVLTEAATGGIL